MRFCNSSGKLRSPIGTPALSFLCQVGELAYSGNTKSNMIITFSSNSKDSQLVAQTSNLFLGSFESVQSELQKLFNQLFNATHVYVVDPFYIDYMYD
jgi:hypothetical protein